MKTLGSCPVSWLLSCAASQEMDLHGCIGTPYFEEVLEIKSQAFPLRHASAVHGDRLI